MVAAAVTRTVDRSFLQRMVARLQKQLYVVDQTRESVVRCLRAAFIKRLQYEGSVTAWVPLVAATVLMKDKL